MGHDNNALVQLQQCSIKGHLWGKCSAKYELAGDAYEAGVLKAACKRHPLIAHRTCFRCGATEQRDFALKLKWPVREFLQGRL